MSKKSFLPVADASTVIFDADRAKNFQVTLAGNRTLKIAGGQEGDEVNVLLVQDNTGSRVPTWSNVTWASGAAPNLSTAAGDSDLITLVKRGSSWEDKGGAPSKLPSRISVAAMATVVSLILGSSGTALYTSKLSGGSGRPSEIGKVGDNRQVLVGTGSDATMTILEEGSGSLLLSSSGANATGLGIGVPNLKSTSKITDANFRVNGEGELTGSSANVLRNLSGSTVAVGSAADRKNAIACFGTGGQLGYCLDNDAADCGCVVP